MATYTLNRMAELLEVNRGMLADWLRLGCPAVERADRDRGIVWQLSLPAIVAWQIERAVADAVSAYAGDGTEMSKDEADRRRAVALALSAEIDLDARRGSLVLRSDAAADMASFCLVLKMGLSNSLSKIAARATTITNAPEIEEMGQAELNRAFRAAREELRTRWSETAAAADKDGQAETGQRRPSGDDEGEHGGDSDPEPGHGPGQPGAEGDRGEDAPSPAVRAGGRSAAATRGAKPGRR